MIWYAAVLIFVLIAIIGVLLGILDDERHTNSLLSDLANTRADALAKRIAKHENASQMIADLRRGIVALQNESDELWRDRRHLERELSKLQHTQSAMLAERLRVVLDHFDRIDHRHIRLDVAGVGNFDEKCACIPESDWQRLREIITKELTKK